MIKRKKKARRGEGKSGPLWLRLARRFALKKYATDYGEIEILELKHDQQKGGIVMEAVIYEAKEGGKRATKAAGTVATWGIIVAQLVPVARGALDWWTPDQDPEIVALLTAVITAAQRFIVNWYRHK